MIRPSRQQTMMEIAHVISKRATCFRLNVGAVIVSRRRIVCTGYNGTSSGEAHCSGNDCPGRNGCNLTIHAEDNALRYLPSGIQAEELYVTHSPCSRCAVLIVNAGIQRVYFTTPYRITESIDWLVSKGVEVYQLTPAGYCIRWSDRELIDLA
jgi:dCMP deaminase